MSESYFTSLNEQYASFLGIMGDSDITIDSLKGVIDQMKADNGYETHGLPEERATIDLYYRKAQEFINQK